MIGLASFGPSLVCGSPRVCVCEWVGVSVCVCGILYMMLSKICYLPRCRIYDSNLRQCLRSHI